MSEQSPLDHCQQMIRVGSKSFSFASRLFGEETRAAALFLYGWCRYCDDQIDEGDPTQALARLAALRGATERALKGEPTEDPVFRALAQVSRAHRIPAEYPLDLLAGMEMDARGQTYSTIEELRLYCYRVAGVVGLMMAHVMGVSDSRALAHACDLGLAMQMTNISRDVMDDAALGRTYLPSSWLEEAGVPASQVADPANRERVFQVVSRLLDRADSLYRSGDQGLRFLPLRSALAVAVARHVYSDIGQLVRRRGARAWDQRAITSKSRKLWAAARALLQVARLVPGRLTRPWAPAAVESNGRHFRT